MARMAVAVLTNLVSRETGTAMQTLSASDQPSAVATTAQKEDPTRMTMTAATFRITVSGLPIIKGHFSYPFLFLVCQGRDNWCVADRWGKLDTGDGDCDFGWIDCKSWNCGTNNCAKLFGDWDSTDDCCWRPSKC